MRNLARTGLALASFLSSGAAAHDQVLADFMGPYQGPGFSGSATTLLGGGTLGGAPAISFPRDNVTLLSWVPLSDFGPAQENANDCWGYVSPSGTPYAILGMHAGTGFVDVSDPGAPQIVHTVAGPHSMWRDMKVFGDVCYAVSEGAPGTGGESGGGIQVMDLSQIDAGVVTLANTVLTPGIEDTHNVAVDEVSGFLYRVGGNSRGLRVYDLTDPLNPAFVGAWDERYVHDAQIVTYTSGPQAGRQLAFCSAGLGASGGMDPSIDVVDVTDKQNMFLARRVYYPNPQYSHQCWLSEDRSLLYVNDELDEDGVFPTTTHVIDVADPDNASYVASFDNGNTAVGHNLYVANGWIYEANYRSGLRVFESSNPLAPTEIAYFDSFPQDDDPNFNGLWSVYPFFESGVVLGSDIEKGLFCLWVGEPLLEFAYPTGVPARIDPAGDSLVVRITRNGGATLQPGTPTLHVDVGSGFAEYPLTFLGGDDWLATFPAAACGSEVRWFVSARSGNNVLWKDVEAAPLESRSSDAASAILLSLLDDGETTAGWTVGAPSDTATTGVWENVDPVGTIAAPDDDHTPGAGTRCWVTQQGIPGGATGAADVDDGRTTLTGPILDLSGADAARVSYWRWYSNDLFGNVDDTFRVEISDDGGASWLPLEELGPGHPESTGGWFQATFAVEDFVALTSLVRLRFIAEDSGSGSWVEAAIDDLEVSAFACEASPGVAFCFGDGSGTACPCGNDVAPGTLAGCANSSGAGATLVASGEARVSADSLAFTLAGGPSSSVALLTSGDNALPMGAGLGIAVFDGLRCVGGNLVRHGTRSIDGAGNAGTWGPPGGPPGGLIAQGGFTAGQTRHFAANYRDDAALSCLTGVNFSHAVSITFEP